MKYYTKHRKCYKRTKKQTDKKQKKCRAQEALQMRVTHHLNQWFLLEHYLAVTLRSYTGRTKIGKKQSDII